ncbi:hypothetical protein [Paenibacillus sp. SI8]|uniref:hypothetical protein n=1 Tax=unclassified Paenibacillus TaxID=185978 RepID=UPI003466DBB4
MSKILIIFIGLFIMVACNKQPPTSSNVENSTIKASPKVSIESKETIKPSPPAVHTETPIPTPAVIAIPTATIKPTGVIKSNNNNSEAGKVITGTFIYPWSNPLNSGTAEVTKLGENKYHLNVSVVHGFGHNIGDIDFDFTHDGKNFVILNDQFKKVTLAFADNSLTIDYTGEEFGGFNAEPKGTFYLKNAGINDVPFLTKLYDKLNLSDQYRNGFTDVLTYNLNEIQQVLLVRSTSSINRNQVVSESLVIYNTLNQSLDILGDVTSNNAQELSKKLESLNADQELIYQLLHKDYADRFIELKMRKFDEGDPRARDLEKFRLTDAEVFYIITGIEGASSISNNTRNSDNIGSIFKTEVDHSDDTTVTIHIYEMVRNGNDDEHTVTADWLEVDRSSGEVASTLFEK